ncbi:hypothetical protein QTP70_031354 [Hemibagrus guttatus]|uniref:Uncharacterized protein n=1 Tax=Hemibagrus guttatus TaxID=175788 RepID=A0AAE0PWE4_9TELE|nr:hypothetical protein QTP70_031354 [Hemibagrus guttatus]
MRTAEKIIGVSLPSITDIYFRRCILKALTHTLHPPAVRKEQQFRLGTAMQTIFAQSLSYAGVMNTHLN